MKSPTIPQLLQSLPEKVAQKLKRKAASEGRSIVTMMRHEYMCYQYALNDQEFEGTLADFLSLPPSEREEYELGAQGFSS